jgi:hypothetical protein
MSRIRPFVNTDLVKVLTGMRRSGKSVMLNLIQEELIESGVSPDSFITLNFESMANTSLCTAESLHSFVIQKSANNAEKTYLFFDEIQEVESWEKCINSLRVDLNCDIYLTGSNAKLLSGELSTYLGGRYVEFEIFPFSFAEFIELYRETFPNTSTHDCFTRYIEFGGMPYLAELKYHKPACQQYLRDLFNSVELKDIVRRNNIRDIDLLERILAYVTVNLGTTFSATTISKYFKSEGRKVSIETILNYLNYCMSAFLFYRVPRQDLIGKKVLAVNEKYYIADHGIKQALYGGNMKDIGLVLENMVYLELIRRGYDVTVGKVGDKEIDFVAQSAEGKLYVQVTYLLASEETITREFNVLKDIDDNYPKYVVSLDEFDMSQDGIKHMNMRDFLLAEKWA